MNDHFIRDYLVPMLVYSIVEDKWKHGIETREFS
jgi:hypothetical protein